MSGTEFISNKEFDRLFDEGEADILQYCDVDNAWRPNHERRVGLAGRDTDEALLPPGNRHEKLAGDRSGQFSIRVNDQYRICFRWTSAGPADVQIVDYH